MHAETIHVVWRPRATWEGADLGVRLLQVSFRPVYRCYLAVAVPLFLVCALSFAAQTWLPSLLIWICKPWLDRTILYALSRALFGEQTGPADVWRARRAVWWAGWPATFTTRRLSASRSFTQPVIQLEGLRGAALRARLKQIATRHRGTARALTQSFAAAEFALVLGLVALEFWLSPHHGTGSWGDLAALAGSAQTALATLFYAVVVAFLEPFYVAAGFGMYLNRRVELEAWDIEQEFRRAFAS